MRAKESRGQKTTLKRKKTIAGRLNFISSDLRKINLRGANLTNSIFITQAQINSAKGDANTRLPTSLIHPAYWDK